MKKIMAVAALLFLPFAPVPDTMPSAVEVVEAQGVGEFLQGITDPHVFAGPAYNPDQKHWSVILTAGVVGPKIGSYPCYISGANVSLNTVAPGLENAPIAAFSMPFLTCAPWGEAVALQTGMSTPIGGGLDVGKSYYFVVGVSLSGGPNVLKAKRIKRIQAKEKARKAALEQGPPSPAS